jgi:glutamate dehydrogenase
MQYVDAISDIMLNVPGTVDLDGHPELIFLGPDENSADLMDPACLFMKQKGYKMWKSFTTGKSPQIGGIPHDLYGMTTRSVRSYVKGIQKKLNLKVLLFNERKKNARSL